MSKLTGRNPGPLPTVHGGTPGTFAYRFINGRWCAVWSDGTVLPVVRGGDGDGGQSTDPPKPPEPPKPPPNTGKTFTQDEVNQMMTREKDEGRRAAERKIAEDLGVAPEEAKTILADWRKQQDDKKTDADKLAEDRKAVDSERQDATRIKHEALVERSIILQGVTDEGKIRRIVGALGDDVKIGSKPDDISAAVVKLREELPELFGTGSPRPPSGNPGGGGRPPQPRLSDDAFKRGEERAKSALTRQTYSFLEKK